MGAPDGLGVAGRGLWDAVTATYSLAAHEEVLLASACEHLDMIARLKSLLSGGLVTTGSAGQPRLAGAVAELRQARTTLSKLLSDLSLPIDDAGEGGEAASVRLPSPASRRASKAAQARHDRARRRLSRVEGA